MSVLTFELERSCYVEAEVNITIEKVVKSLGDESAFGKADGVGEHELENVTAGFNVDTKAE